VVVLAHTKYMYICASWSRASKLRKDSFADLHNNIGWKWARVEPQGIKGFTLES